MTTGQITWVLLKIMGVMVLFAAWSILVVIGWMWIMVWLLAHYPT